MKVLAVVGARPQFIKAAPVERALLRRGVDHVLVHTGQHYDDNLSAVFFRDLELRPPRHDLGIGSGPHGAQTGAMLRALERVVALERPEWIVVYGDTNSTLAGALAGAKMEPRVAHVEAGLRSFNRSMPEEINRVLTDHAADLLLAPTRAAVENLRREGIPGDRVLMVGDVMYDAALQHGPEASDGAADRLDRLGVEPGGYVLATCHRAGTTDDPARLRAVFEGLATVAADLPVVVLLHPRTRGALERDGLLSGVGARLDLREPVGYLDMLALERGARLVATDSGGIQKEAFFCGVPCVTLRGETEWVELVEAGWNRLLPPSSAPDVAGGVYAALAAEPPAHRPRDLYGGGKAAERIVDALVA
jgi:UDP-GlcNAc3NAcA epimerase